jgi:hypothetical protein
VETSEKITPWGWVLQKHQSVSYWRILTPKPQAEGPPLVGCAQLIIQYFHSYALFLEAVSSIRNPRTRHAVLTRDPPNISWGRSEPEICLSLLHRPLYLLSLSLISFRNVKALKQIYV